MKPADPGELKLQIQTVSVAHSFLSSEVEPKTEAKARIAILDLPPIQQTQTQFGTG